MSHLLHVEASPRKERSSSLCVARAFLDAYRETHPTDRVETLDLWAIELPEFDGDTIDAKYRIRGGAYGDDSGAAEGDFQKSYFDMFLRFIGFGAIENVVVEPTQAVPERAESARTKACVHAAELAARF